MMSERSRKALRRIIERLIDEGSTVVAIVYQRDESLRMIFADNNDQSIEALKADMLRLIENPDDETVVDNREQ